MLANYVLLDLETTGGTPLRDRITEIALVRYEDEVEVARWQTLVNPETTIPVFIQQLTGITDQMVKNAPTFKQVAAELLCYLEGSVLCAHNARFDHGFLKQEFKAIGINLRQKVLCTVKLSRRLYPEQRSHSLDSLISRHGLTCHARHRAMGDVEMMVGFLTAASLELGLERVRAAAAVLLNQTPSLPPGIDPELIDALPETPGVYLFYGDNQLPLYIGKSINIRQRVLSHFSSDHSSSKEMRISQEIKHIEWIETAGEFGALLLESKLIKERQPLHNRRLRRQGQLCAWRLAEDSKAQLLVELVGVNDIQPESMGQLFGVYRSRRQAITALREIADNHQLCPKLLGLESSSGVCFSYQLKRCRGGCGGIERVEIHYLRLQQAVLSQKLKTWPYSGKIGLYEQDKLNQKSQLHVFEHWVHLATVDSEAELHEMASMKHSLIFDLDTYRLLNHALSKPGVKVVELAAGD
ncbi:MAG: exonuclease domain-containing protein [Burkholderiales bacterium]